MGINFCPPFAPGSADPCLTLRSFARRDVARFAAIVLSLAATAVAAGQSPPILNSPYVCANGITYTVTICKPYGADQWCETTETQNGRLVTTMDSSWSSMTGRLKGCTNAAAGKPAGATPSAPATPAAPPAGGTQQAFNPPYLREFPTVDQIMAQLKGSSAQDTAYRQLTALHEFAQMIAALAGPRMAQNKLTPDEVRVLTNYFNAYTNLAKSITNPQDAYAGQPAFTASLFTTFNMPTIQQLWQTSQNMASSQQNGPSELPPTNDPSQIAMRRCFELGGSPLQCVGAGMSTGMQQMIGINLSALVGPGKSGLIILGTFRSASGLTFGFFDTGLDISGCGKMVQGAHNYSVSPSGSKYVLNIANQPQALVVSLGTDGKAVGPAAQDITGQQITGYEVTTNVKTGAVIGRQPIYGPITVHCTVGALAPGPYVAVDPGLPSSSSSVLSALGTVMGMAAGDAAPSLMLHPGPRMAGVFGGGGGLKIQFNDGNAIVDCAQAHVLVPYDVSMQAGAATISVKNGSSPFSLTIQADGSLAGTGQITVNGKLMTGLNGSDPVFAATSATCPVGTLTAAK